MYMSTQIVEGGDITAMKVSSMSVVRRTILSIYICIYVYIYIYATFHSVRSHFGPSYSSIKEAPLAAQNDDDARLPPRSLVADCYALPPPSP